MCIKLKYQFTAAHSFTSVPIVSTDNMISAADEAIRTRLRGVSDRMASERARQTKSIKTWVSPEKMRPLRRHAWEKVHVLIVISASQKMLQELQLLRVRIETKGR